MTFMEVYGLLSSMEKIRKLFRRVLNKINGTGIWTYAKMGFRRVAELAG